MMRHLLVKIKKQVFFLFTYDEEISIDKQKIECISMTKILQNSFLVA